MIVVIHNEQLEPVNVIQLSRTHYKAAAHAGKLTLEIHTGRLMPNNTDQEPAMLRVDTVTLTFTKLRNGEHDGYIVTTNLPLVAQRLPCAFLPVQEYAVESLQASVRYYRDQRDLMVDSRVFATTPTKAPA